MIPKLKDLLLEATEDDKYTHIGYGKYKLKKDVGSDGKSEKGSPTFKKDKESGDYKKISGGGNDKKKEKPKGQKLSGNDFTRDSDKKQDKPKKAPLAGIDVPPHPDSPSQQGATLKGPQSNSDAVGTDAARERAIIAGVQKLVHDDRDVDLCKVSVPGSNLFCGDNKGIPRHEMPQLKSKPIPGGKADRMVTAGILKTDKEGEVNTEELFLQKIGKEAPIERVKVTDLKATQNQLVGKKVSLFLNQLQHGDPDSEFTKKLNEPIIVARDPETGETYIVDGHHRWAALVAQDIANGGDGDIEMNVKVVDAPIEEVIEQSNNFTEEMGLETKSGDNKKWLN